MRLLLWYCERFAWQPSLQTLEDAPEPYPGDVASAVVAFVHVEPSDTAAGGTAETKLVKNVKWLARKWDVTRTVLHSFTHLGEDKALPRDAKALLDRAEERLQKAGYSAVQTPYGYFLDLAMDAPGHPLARIYKVLS